MTDLDFYRGKKVFLTGHTGFKGSWMCQTLLMAGAEVTGYSLEPPTNPSLFGLCSFEDDITSIRGDIRDLNSLQRAFNRAKPEIVIHMAAQPIVRESYKYPVLTYETNVMGTVNILECVRMSSTVKSFVNVTTDKVYKNREWEWGYRENEELGGSDPYSCSKACSELVTECYGESFLRGSGVAVSTARAGNVIGGGDFAPDRIVPDCVRAAISKKPVSVRNPGSVRPYQHVLEPVLAYLMVGGEQYRNPGLAGSYNVGPGEGGCASTGELAAMFCRKWKEATGEEAAWEERGDGGPHEAGCLKLDCSRIKRVFSWKPRWSLETAVEKTVEFYAACLQGEEPAGCMERQIRAYLDQGRDMVSPGA